MSKKEVDIFTVDQNIIDNFQKEKEKLSEYTERYEAIIRSLENETDACSLKNRVRKSLETAKCSLKTQIDDIQNDVRLNLYRAETAEILEQYKTVLNTPVRQSFTGPPVINREKKNLVQKYLKIASKYTDVELPFSRKEVIVCKNCGNKKDFDCEDTSYVCGVCSASQVVLKNTSSYKDVDRINGSCRYVYVRKIHFRDAIAQFQGKQNCTIQPEVYEKLEKELENHGLVNFSYDKTDRLKRYSSVTKDHIRIFLQELGYPKHYENINLIHYNITGKPPDDISYLEEKLVQDFDTLTELYDKVCKDLDRKSFINTQYVLYQLLLKHKHKCKQEDFAILKTTDRKHFHNDIMSKLFNILGWSFTPT